MILLLLPVLTFTQDQEPHSSVNTSGGDATGLNGSVSYSVGQVFFNSTEGADKSVSEGVQQPFEITVTTGVNTLEKINPLYYAYPNPVANELFLKVDASIIADSLFTCYKLYDQKGNLLSSDRLKNIETKIKMSELPPAAYILQITMKNKIGKTFKIIKN